MGGRRIIELAGCALLAVATATAALANDVSRRPSLDFARGSGLAVRDTSGDVEQLRILEQNGQGVCALDADGDGLLDLYLVNGSTLELFLRGEGPGSALLRNRGDGTFVDVTMESGIGGPPWGSGCAAADFDGDGRTDLFVAGFGESRLYRNAGGGSFEDVSSLLGAGVPGWASSAAWADLDGDGLLDLAVSRYVEFDLESEPMLGSDGSTCQYRGIPAGCPPIAYLPESTAVFRQVPGGGFTDVSVSSGAAAAITRGFGLAALPLFEDSRLPDVYVVADQMLNVLLANRSRPGAIRFEEVGVETGTAFDAGGVPEAGMGLAVGDVFEDGLPDLLVTNFVEQTNTLYRNRGAIFEDATAGSGLEAHAHELGWGVVLVDLDADSHLDAAVANGHVYPQVDHLGDPREAYEQPLRLYGGDGRGRFEEATPPALAVPRSRRGLVAADLNNDGRLDLVAVVHRGEPEIFWNRSTAENHWVRFTVAGHGPPDPMGARLTITLPDGTRRTSWHVSDQGYQSSQDPRVFFGLGSFDEVTSLEIRWPGGGMERHGSLRADRDYRITEGGGVGLLDVPSFPAPCGAASQPDDSTASGSQSDSRSRHLGAAACADCHRQRFETFAETSHHLTSRRANRASVAGSFDLATSRLLTADPDLWFEMTAENGGLFQTAVLRQGKSETRLSVRMDIVLGSGKLGQSYLAWEGVRLVQLPVSYFTPAHRWVNSPGYLDGTADFSRPVFPRCLECHATFAAAPSQESNAYDPASLVLGISCERCHGPGAAHVAYHRAHPAAKGAVSVLDPRRLDRSRQLDLCVQCHGGVGTPLAPPFSYRPGETLAGVLELGDGGEAPGEVHANDQYARLRSSRCFQESATLTCQTCHDPHRRERGNAELFARRCLACHESRRCADSDAAISGRALACIDCHMPERPLLQTPIQRPASLELPAMRDHRIAIHPSVHSSEDRTQGGEP